MQHIRKRPLAALIAAFFIAPAGALAQQVEQQLPEVKVREQKDEGFAAREAPGVTRSDLPLRDIPASVKVIPRAVIDEQQALRLDQAVRNASGVIFTDGGEGTNFSSRGFGITTFRDGWRRTEFTEGDLNRAEQDTYNVERIEVLKGPASALFGRSNSGGLINIVTKRPLASPVAQVNLTAGSFDLRRATVDIGNALAPDSGVAVRLNAGYEESNSFRDLVESRRELFAPSLSWRLDRTTTVTVFGEYASVRQTPDVGLPRQGNEILPGLPFSRFLGEPSTDRDDSEVRDARLLVEKEAGDWSFKAALRKGAIENASFFTRGAALRADGRTLDRAIIDSGFKSEDTMLQLEALGKLQFWSLAHRVTLGVDAGTRETTSLFNSARANEIDIFDPVYGRTGPAPTATFFRFSQRLKQDLSGAFAHDTISLGERWKVALGLRLDRFKQAPSTGNPGALPTREYSRTSPRAGLVYQPQPYLSWYVAYDKSFQVPNGFPLQFGGAPLEPQRATLQEAGLKTEWLGGRLISTAAVYRIDRTNVGTRDLQNPGFQVAIGEQRSEGFELDVSGEVAPGWKLIAGYGYTDAEIVRDNAVAPGKMPPGVPRHAASLWTSYEFQGGDFKGLGVGAGAYYLSERQGDANNTFQVPSYTRIDATVFYKLNRALTARFNVYNLTDRELLLNPTRAPFFMPDAPRRYLATLEWKFL